MRWWLSRRISMIATAWLSLSAYGEPVAFSHRNHAGFELRCTMCHPQAKSAERAGLPTARECLMCHETLKKPKLDPSRLSWQPTARLPEFVFFSHAIHHKAGVRCDDCHGDVNRIDVPGPPASLTMRECLACHRLRKASVECNVCHSVRQ